MNYKMQKTLNGEKKYYECFSLTLLQFLEDKGIMPDQDEYGNTISYKHIDTGKKCFIFTVTQELSDALGEWSSIKNRR